MWISSFEHVHICMFKCTCQVATTMSTTPTQPTTTTHVWNHIHTISTQNHSNKHIFGRRLYLFLTCFCRHFGRRGSTRLPDPQIQRFQRCLGFKHLKQWVPQEKSGILSQLREHFLGKLWQLIANLEMNCSNLILLVLVVEWFWDTKTSLPVFMKYV